MPLDDELRSDQRPHGISCTVCSWIAKRPDGEEFRAAFKDRSFSTTSIFRAMKKRGYKFGSNGPDRHRRGGHE